MVARDRGIAARSRGRRSPIASALPTGSPAIIRRCRWSSSAAARRPNIYACSLCHYPNGKGRPENANVTGLTYEYFVQTLKDFKNGARKTSDPRKANTGLMEHLRRTMTDAEIKAAAKYFTAIPCDAVDQGRREPTRFRRPGRRAACTWCSRAPRPARSRSATHHRDAEKAHDTEFLRNPRSGFTAYVPPGSLKKGEALVKNGTTASGNKATACTICHGSDLRGLGPLPTLAGRSPSYIARQLYDMQHGNRNGEWTVLMAPVIAGISPDDVLNASAYLASLHP